MSLEGKRKYLFHSRRIDLAERRTFCNISFMKSVERFSRYDYSFFSQWLSMGIDGRHFLLCIYTMYHCQNLEILIYIIWFNFGS